MHQISNSFRRNIVESRFAPIIFAIIAMAMRLALFLSVGIQPQEYPTSLAWHVMSPLFSNDWISLGASTASIFLIAFLFSNLNQRYTLTRFRTSLPFVLILFVLSIHPHFLAMSPNYLSVILLLVAISPLLESYQRSSPRNFAFNAGVLIALSGTFQVLALALLPLWWYGETSMHGFRIKSFLALLLGVLLVLWNVAGFYFLFDSLQNFLTPFTHFNSINFSVPHYHLITWVIIGLLSLLVIIIVVMDIQIFQRERVLTQKTLSFIILIAFFSTILHLLYWHQTFFFMQLTIIMLTFIVAHYFSYTKTKGIIYLFLTFFSGLSLIFIYHLIGKPLLF